VVLPVVMTAVQLGLFAASLALPREPWVIPVPPSVKDLSEPQCSGENCEVTFYPAPEPRTGRILKAAMVLNLPAVFLGAFLVLSAGLAHIPHITGDPGAIVFGAVFVPLIWYRIGRWVDGQRGLRNAAQANMSSLGEFWIFLVRLFAWAVLLMAIYGLTPAYHHRTRESSFLFAALILWLGAFLAGGLWSGWRMRRLAKAKMSLEG
jgi:hypothetical protein